MVDPEIINVYYTSFHFPIFAVYIQHFVYSEELISTVYQFLNIDFEDKPVI